MSDGKEMRRPGGRSARVRAAVHQATLELLEERRWEEISIPLVAERAGVHQATLYRRWGTMPALLDDVVDEWSSTTAALPDTGTLRGDLEVYAAAVAAPLQDSLVPLILRAVVLEIRPGEPRTPSRAFRERERQLQAMLDRARDRGEQVPTLAELLEVVVAPLYFYALFSVPLPAADAGRLVDRLLGLVGQKA
ncbi:TetR family transcriptional regulator [Isoptericola jiangsuensis]|uniref:TetR family transcriptional regulator n=1 Tax=Isoptericola jiangsuensis TaxID=548579 RepID=A0A2A9F128_9MICO|nr:TetR-like C-terminal domain-containing protein [Isoptericola jiangsuensis]PFG44175.1 TetR family transcriptional regulator [Isoptericola jiangsuensis]